MADQGLATRSPAIEDLIAAKLGFELAITALLGIIFAGFSTRRCESARPCTRRCGDSSLG